MEKIKMAKFEVLLNKSQLSLAKASVKDTIKVFEARKQDHKVPKFEDLLKALGKKKIVLTTSECNGLRNSAKRSMKRAVLSLTDADAVTSKHVDAINALKDLAKVC
jgi:hypothetical protein